MTTEHITFYVEAAREFVKEFGRTDVKDAQFKLFNNILTFESISFAQESAYDCAVAGNLSHFKRVADRYVCVVPDSARCGAGKVRCNEILFGADLCVDISSSSTQLCFSLSAEKGVTSKSLAEKIKTDADFQRKWDEDSAAINGVCTSGEFSKRGVCRTLANRVNAIARGVSESHSPLNPQPRPNSDFNSQIQTVGSLEKRQKKQSIDSNDVCTEVRIDGNLPDGRPGSMSRVPVTDQGDIGICYAHAAAQLVDSYRFSHNSETGGDKHYDHLTSPLFASVRTNFFGENRDLLEKENNEEIDLGIEGGQICDAVNQIRQDGSCDKRLEDQVRNRENIKDFLVELAKKKQEYEGLKRKNEEARKRIAGEIQCCMAENGVDKQIIPVLDVIERALDTSDSRSLSEYIYKPCRDGHIMRLDNRRPTFECVEKNYNFLSNKNSLRDFVMANISKAYPEPVGLSLCSGLFFHGNESAFVNFAGRLKKGCNPHAVVAIGKRCNPKTGRPEILIRNSWGKGKYNMSPDVTQDNGNIWVDLEALEKNTFGVSMLKMISK